MKAVTLHLECVQDSTARPKRLVATRVLCRHNVSKCRADGNNSEGVMVALDRRAASCTQRARHCAKRL